MKQLLFIFGLVSVILLGTPAMGAPEDDISTMSGPATLRDHITVSDTYIRLGDLFENIDQTQAQTAIAYAPKPGRRASFDARWLYRVARAYGLEWRPLSADLRVTVTRDSIVIQRDEIEEAIMAALIDHDLPENANVELSNRNMRLHVASDILPDLQVEDISLNRRSMRFAAILSVGEKDRAARQRVRVTGQVHRMVEVPTLSNRIQKGDIIEASDIAWVRMRADRIQRSVITDIDHIVGMSPKRHLRAETPIRASDVQRPVLVQKGKLVTIILKKPGMTLTSQGRALQNGADGDTVRISNTNTKRTIEAIVVGSDMVTVLPGGFRSNQLAFNQ